MSQDWNRAQELADSPGTTALMIAQARANESRRPDRLVDDPLAANFVAAAGAAFPAGSAEIANLLRLRGDFIAVRTRFYDDYLLDACAAGCRQVALLAAGLDARAFRLPWPAGVTLFELDLPPVLAFKEMVLARLHSEPGCVRVVVPADLRADWPAALLSAGFRPGAPTAWLLEGILMYLAEEKRDRLLDRVGELSAAGSQVALDQRGVAEPGRGAARGMPDAGGRESASEQARQANDAAAARLGVRIPGEHVDPSVADPIAWLGRHGWHARASTALELFASYGRQVEPVAAEAASGLFIAQALR